MSAQTNAVELDDAGNREPEFYVERAGGYSDGYLVKQRGVGTVCECFDDTGREAREIARLLNGRHFVASLIEAARNAESLLPLNSSEFSELNEAIARVQGGAK